MKKVSFTTHSFAQFNYWAENDPKIHKKIVDLIKDIAKTPFTGLGKPEALRYDFKGCWSRRITEEHRLVYYIEEDEIVVVSCRYHYN